MFEPGAGQSEMVLPGREPEMRALTVTLDAVGAGSASVVISGDAGQGKTSLLRWLAGTGHRRGFAVVEAAGVEFERELAFGGLSAVLRPFLGRSGTLGPVQQHALEVAMGVVVGDAPRLTTYGTALALLAAAADERPVLVVLDDAQWLDQASLEALLFAAQRAGADRIGFAFAQRSGVASLLDGVGFGRIELAGLDRDVAVELLAGHGVAPGVADRCWRLTGGNPLAMLEGARGLTEAQRAGAEPLPPALPVAARLLGAFRARVDALPDETVRALGLAALEPSDRLAIVAAALTIAGCGIADLEPAERDQLLRLAGDRLTWHHPLLRSAVYQGIDPDWQRRAHRALADSARAAGQHEAALWHLSEAVVGPDASLAGQLAALGATARRRGALAAAAEAHQKAARLSTNHVEGARQLVAAADACMAGGDFVGVVDLLVDRIADVDAPEVQAEMAMALGQAEMWTTGTEAAIARFEPRVAAVSEACPDLAAFLLLHAATARMLGLDAAGATSAAARAVAFSERTGDAGVLFGASAMHALARLFAGADSSVGEQLGPLAQMILAVLDTGAEGADDLAQLCAYGLAACERWGEATDLLRRVVRSSETAGMMARNAFARIVLTEVLWRTGRWAESLAELSQSFSLQEAVRPGHIVTGTAALMARLEAGFGQEDSCRAHAAQVFDGPPIELFTVTALSALGLLELGAGRASEAASAFDQVAARAGRVGEPGWLWWQGDAIEAYAAAGRDDDARRTLLRLDAQATVTGRTWARATVARGEALLASEGDAADTRFAAALDGFRSVGAPFEEARTLLLRGQQRLNAGAREGGARDLAAARTIFDRLGARPWSERATALAGGSPAVREAGGSLTSRLTPAELRVALAVGHGASNRDAADQLFISPKTVDAHLQSIYRKLALRSRSQLMALVLTGNP